MLLYELCHSFCLRAPDVLGCYVCHATDDRFTWVTILDDILGCCVGFCEILDIKHLCRPVAHIGQNAQLRWITTIFVVLWILLIYFWMDVNTQLLKFRLAHQKPILYSSSFKPWFKVTTFIPQSNIVNLRPQCWKSHATMRTYDRSIANVTQPCAPERKSDV